MPVWTTLHELLADSSWTGPAWTGSGPKGQLTGFKFENFPNSGTLHSQLGSADGPSCISTNALSELRGIHTGCHLLMRGCRLQAQQGRQRQEERLGLQLPPAILTGS